MHAGHSAAVNSRTTTYTYTDKGPVQQQLQLQQQWDMDMDFTVRPAQPLHRQACAAIIIDHSL